MKFAGEDAVGVLESMPEVDLWRKDGTDKFWCYKLRSGSRAEFAFDPRTKTKLIVRVDREPPEVAGLVEIESLQGKAVSTALDPIFSGRGHRARYKARVSSESALRAFVLAL